MKILLIILCIALLFRNKREGNKKRKRTGAYQAVKRLLWRKANKRYRNEKKKIKDQASEKIDSL